MGRKCIVVTRAGRKEGTVEYSPLYFILLLHALWPWLGAFSQECQELWLPKDDLRDSSSWSSSPLMLLRDIHSKIITQYDWKEVCVPSLSQVNGGAGDRLSSQDGVSQQQETATLTPPKLD
jgi:hypothetical protein